MTSDGAPEFAALSFGAAFLAGLMGSTHCLAMCGGLAGAVGMHARAYGVSPARSFVYAMAAQLGRIGSYASFGALAGASGAILGSMLDLVKLANALRVAAGILLIAIAVRIVTRWNVFAPLERLGARIWSRVAPLGRELGRQTAQGGYRSGIQSGNMGRALLFGAVWGWLPCGLVYSMLIFAVATGGALQGAITMAVFGLGTVPAMLSSSLLASQLARSLRVNAVRWFAASVLAAFGVWTMIAVGWMRHGGHH